MTNEKALELVKAAFDAWKYLSHNIFFLADDNLNEKHEARDMAIKALEQELILDKIKAEIEDTLHVDSLIFGELIDFKNGKISADDVIDEFNRVTRMEILQIIDKYKAESEEV